MHYKPYLAGVVVPVGCSSKVFFAKIPVVPGVVPLLPCTEVYSRGSL